MASPGHRRRSNSIEQPPYIAEVLYLKDELNRLHDNTSSECHERIKRMTGLVDDFEKDYKRATRAMIGGGITAATAAISGIALAFITAGISAILGTIAAIGTAAGITVVILHFQKQQKEKNTRQKFEDQLTELQNKISPVIDVLQKLFDLTQRILSEPSVSEHKANMIRECFSCFEQMQLFQIDDNRGITTPMSKAVQLTENFSKVFTKMDSLLEILKEIIEDDIEHDKDKNKNTDNRSTDKDTPTETPTSKQEKEFKKKSATFINEMREGIKTLQNMMNEIDQMKSRISQRFE